MKSEKGYSTLEIVLAAGVLVALVLGYFLGGIGKVPESAYTALQQRYQELNSTIAAYKAIQQKYQELNATIAAGKIRAAFVYVGPIGDYGWSHAHDVGRRYVQSLFPWLETFYVESVSAADAPSVIDSLISQKHVNVVFTTSFDFMDATVEEAKKYPNIIFFHCSGFKRAPNLGTYFAEFYQLYYLNGLMAGALTKTNKIGYVGAYPIPEVVRHINAFALGVKEVNPDAKVYVRWIFDWYAPDKARQAAQALVSDGVDVIAYTEDSPAIIQFAEDQYKAGKPVYVFSHYSPMYDYGPDVVVSGQLVNWGKIYADILIKVKEGIYNTTNLENVDYWWMLKEGAVELGAKFGMPINPKFESALKSKIVKDSLTGKDISVYDLVFERLKLMSEETVPFDPFTGPIKAQNGTIMIPAGLRATHDMLWTINWFVDNVVGSPTG